jgi:hypothetical protein
MAEVFPRRAPAGRGTRSIASTGCLEKLAPDAKAGYYRIARLRER